MIQGDEEKKRREEGQLFWTGKARGREGEENRRTTKKKVVLEITA